MAANHASRLKALPLPDQTTSAILAFVWASTDTPALRELLWHVRQSLSLVPGVAARPQG
jgi:hypothetical protein